MDLSGIKYPWIVVYQEGKNSLESDQLFPVLTMLVGPKSANADHFYMVTADLIRHMANCFHEDPNVVLDKIKKHMEDPSRIVGPVSDLLSKRFDS